jgi:hypothetical protein
MVYEWCVYDVIYLLWCGVCVMVCDVMVCVCVCVWWNGMTGVVGCIRVYHICTSFYGVM